MNNNLGQIELVKEINLNTSIADAEMTAIPSGSYPSRLFEFQERIYFVADNGEVGDALWVTDGTAEDTQLVKDINQTGTDDSSPRLFTEFDGRLYFTADDGVNGNELWVTDGTTDGTQLVKDIRLNTNDSIDENDSSPRNLTVFGDRLLFTADDGEVGDELWVTDGTTDGTRLVKDINPGTTDGYFEPFTPNLDSSSIGDLEILGDRVYFAADDGENGSELWATDGTTEGTQLVKDIYSGVDSDRTYFYEREGKSRPIESSIPFDSRPAYLTEFADKLYFAASDAENGRELWATDGTAEGTQLVKNINLEVDESGDVNSSNPGNFTEVDGKLYFSATDSETGTELWVTDGTAEGTQLVKDINLVESGNADVSATSDSISPIGVFIEFEDKLYFTADDGINGDALWVSDGTAEGTQLVKDINSTTFDNGRVSYSQSPEISSFTEFNDKLYFAADDGINGNELWVTDGTTEGTQLVEDFNPGSLDDDLDNNYSGLPRNGELTVVGDELFFAANDGEIGTELYKLTVDDFDDLPEPESDRINSLTSSSSSSSSSSNGNSILTGGIGDDLLTGGSGDDLLDGAFGADTLKGGEGNDIFTLRAGDGTDTIVDFSLDSDSLRLVDGLKLEDLDIPPDGSIIFAGEEVLVNLEGIDAASLTTNNFEAL